MNDDPKALTLFRTEVNGTLCANGGDRKSEKAKNQPDGVRLKDYGNNSDYWQARIQRDAPEEIEALAKGVKTIMDVRRERGWGYA